MPGRCRVGRLNLEGDGQGDLAGHGGEQRAVYVYQIESYRYWQQQLKRTDFVFGQFGENFTIEGLPDDVVCIGDRYRIGSALFGDAAAGHLLSRRYSDERAAHASTAHVQWTAGLLLARLAAMVFLQEGYERRQQEIRLRGPQVIDVCSA